MTKIITVNIDDKPHFVGLRALDSDVPYCLTTYVSMAYWIPSDNKKHNPTQILENVCILLNLTDARLAELDEFNDLIKKQYSEMNPITRKEKKSLISFLFNKTKTLIFKFKS